MACTGNTIKIPINIDKTKMMTFQKSSNLTKFNYEFQNISEITVTGTNSGIFSITQVQKAVANISTLGKLDLVGTQFYMKSVNEYNGEKMDMEIVLIFTNKNDKYVCMFIPVKQVEVTSASAKWFGQFAGFITTNNETISVNNFNYNDIIPRDSFITYKSTIPYIGGCTLYVKCIFFEKAITIKQDDYNSLTEIFGETKECPENVIRLRNQDVKKVEKCEEDKKEWVFTEAGTLYSENVNNYKTIHEIDEKNVFLNEKGTNSGPGLGTNDTLPLICTPVEDEKDNPILGTRLDWIQDSFGGIDAETKNIFYLIIIVAVLIGAMVFLHSFIFKNIGKLLGDDAIVTRSSSLI